MSEDTVQRGAAGMPEAPAKADDDLPSVDDLEEAMRDVVDPELGINVVDLGLLYGIDVQGDPAVAEKLEDELEDAVAFAGVSKYPARIKCALMSWMALKDASARAWGGNN